MSTHMWHVQRQEAHGATLEALDRGESSHVAPHSSKASGLIKLMPLPLPRFNSPVNPGQEPVRTSGAPAHTPGALSPSVRA
jgi:hypothetical protein